MDLDHITQIKYFLSQQNKNKIRENVFFKYDCEPKLKESIFYCALSIRVKNVYRIKLNNLLS